MARDKNPQRRDPLPGLPARRAALELILAVRRDQRMLAEVLDAEDSPLVDLGPSDRARAQRLATETLRHGSRIDAALSPYLRKAPHIRLRMLLWLATTELCVDHAAPHGVVNSAVALARAHPKTGHLSGMANAVLRRVCDDVVPAWDALKPARLPKWLRAPLIKAYGPKPVAAMERGLASAPPLDLTPKDGDAAALAARLDGTATPSGSVRLGTPGQVSALDGFGAGDWWVQDAAAAMPVRVLAPQTGETALDICAAPGGKTMQLAAAGAAVTALDISGPRMKRLTENLTRCRLSAQTVVADALNWSPEGTFDAILLDAPCSATGTLRRHPDLPWVKTGDDVAPLVALQEQLLDRALTWLAPGGRLIYCTCSLLPEEGETQIARALTRHPGLTAADLDPAPLGLPEDARTAHGLRLRPDFWADTGGMDGFFIAQLTRADTPTA